MKESFTKLLKFLSENKDGLEVLISIIQNIGSFILLLLGGFLAYLALFREIKFSRIKELYFEQNELKRKIREEVYKAKIYFEAEMIGNEAKFILNKEILIETKTKLGQIFELSANANFDLANQIHLLNVFINSCIEILKREKEINENKESISFWEAVDEFHLYKYINFYLNLITLGNL
jgi:hypothetical protein